MIERAFGRPARKANELFEGLYRLNPEQDGSGGDERGHPCQTVAGGQLLVGDHLFEMLAIIERLLQIVCVQSNRRGKRCERRSLAYVFAAFEVGAEYGFIHQIEIAAFARPCGGFVRRTGARFDLRHSHQHLQSFGKRVDRLLPDAAQVFALRVRQGRGFGPQFECAPGDFEIGNAAFKLSDCRLAEPAERSNVIGKYFEFHLASG